MGRHVSGFSGTDQGSTGRQNHWRQPIPTRETPAVLRIMAEWKLPAWSNCSTNPKSPPSDCTAGA